MSSKNYTNLALHDPTNEITNRHNQNMKHMRLKTYSNSQRAQGGMGLLSHENSVQDLHKSMAKILPRREKGGRTWREKRRAAGSFLLFCPAHPSREGSAPFVPESSATPASCLPSLPSKSSSKRLQYP
jgi:hypothetical protein